MDSPSDPPKPSTSSRARRAAKAKDAHKARVKALKESKRVMIPITADMTPEEQQRAKKNNDQARNSLSASKSRMYRLLSVVELDNIRTGIDADMKILLSLLGGCRDLLVKLGMSDRWDELCRRAVPETGSEMMAVMPLPEVAPETLSATLAAAMYARKPDIEHELARVISEVRKEVAAKVETGVILENGLALATTAGRITGKRVGDFEAEKQQQRADELRVKIKSHEELVSLWAGKLREAAEKTKEASTKLNGLMKDRLLLNKAAEEFGLTDRVYSDPVLASGQPAIPLPVSVALPSVKAARVEGGPMAEHEDPPVPYPEYLLSIELGSVVAPDNLVVEAQVPALDFSLATNALAVSAN